MTAKEKFLINNIGFHFEDLSLMRQAELESIASELNVSQEWIYLALSKDKLEGWEKWGFALFRKPEFKRDIDNLLSVLNKMDESKFKKELKKKDKIDYISCDERVFRQCYEAVLAQGRIYTEDEAAALGLTDYWTWSSACGEETKVWINMTLAEKKHWGEVEEEEWAAFCIAVRHDVRHEIAAIKPAEIEIEEE